jgi:hypothetical protein
VTDDSSHPAQSLGGLLVAEGVVEFRQEASCASTASTMLPQTVVRVQPALNSLKD